MPHFVAVTHDTIDIGRQDENAPPMTVFHTVSVQGIEPRLHEGDLLHNLYSRSSGTSSMVIVKLPLDTGMSFPFTNETKWGGRTQIEFSQFSHRWKNEFEAMGVRGGRGREKSLRGANVPVKALRLTSPDVWPLLWKKFGSHVNVIMSLADTKSGTCPRCSMILSGKAVGLRGSMGVVLVVEMVMARARARARAERIVVKNFMVRWGLS